MPQPAGSESSRSYALLAILAPMAIVLLTWTVLAQFGMNVRVLILTAMIVTLGLLAARLPRRGLWVSYGAATMAVLLPLLAAVTARLPRDVLVVQWLGILGVAAVVTFLASTVYEQTRRAERLDQLKSSFVALAHHELRTPVAVLHGTLDTLADELRDALTPEQESFLMAARSSSGALAYLVETMTQFHELERAPDSHIAVRSPLGALVQSAALDLQQVFEQHGVALEIRLAPEAALSDVPRTYARIALEQLLRNAAKFNAPGGRAAVRARVDGPELIVEVRDDGWGIAPEMQASVFESFFQDGELLSRTAGGLGLGLALARTAVEKMSGTIELDSAPGRGSTFTIRLPRPQGLAGAA
jgi:signal transduction histidine kinase